MGKPPPSPKSGKPQKLSQNDVVIAKQTAEVLKEIGIDPSETPEQIKHQVQLLTSSISRSPYTSASMLKEYVDAGLPEVKDRALNAIDQERHHRMEMDRAQLDMHKQAMTETIRQQRRGQYGSWYIATLSVCVAAVANWFGVSASVCYAIVIVGVGGPSAATAFARVLDRMTPKGE